jgi:hypothetical protein
MCASKFANLKLGLTPNIEDKVEFLIQFKQTHFARYEEIKLVGNRLKIVEEFVGGTTLSEWLSKFGVFRPSFVSGFTFQIM